MLFVFLFTVNATTIAIGVLVLLIATFPFMLNKLSQESGWKKLVKTFGAKEKAASIKGEKLPIKSAYIGGFSYNNVLRIFSTRKGLLIRMRWPFSMSHSPILLPWKYLQPAKEKATKGKVEIGKPAITSMTFKEKDYKKILSAINRRGN